MKLKSVIFDFDGVIMDSERIHFQVDKVVFDQYGAQITEEEYFDFAGISEKKTYNHFINKYNMKVTFQQLLDLKIKGFISYLSSSRELPVVNGVVELIKNLHNSGILLSIGTSGTRQIADTTLRKLNIHQYFEILVTGSEEPKTKPDPAIFLKILEATNSIPREAIVIEDTYTGIMAAKNAGLKVVGYRNLSSGNQDLSGADMIVNSMHELNLNVLEQLLE
jgi:HAD superfamily hydrolase (TIGR01509 family)